MTAPTYRRFVALGDSFTEGLGDHDPTRPNGCRGWADRVAEVLAVRTDEFGYANLAIRGRKLLGVVEEQVEPALALEPDLVTLYAGANDILRPSVDLDALVARYADAVGRLAATGAQVVLFTAFDPGATRVYRPVRGRFALYNELVREVADDHGTLLVDFWRIRDHRDQRLWDVDRMHMGPLGHHRVAIEVLDVLGVEHALVPEVLPDPEPLARAARLRADLAWSRDHLLPWVHRRVTGRSSGDTINPRHPSYAQPGAVE
ncbi:MAG: SGNH/GDSL hydrolase family protein [Nocardioides sp.]|nr:SGNH/GDSL hydrolase family protein [Nocardioides sp.]